MRLAPQRLAAAARPPAWVPLAAAKPQPEQLQRFVVVCASGKEPEGYEEHGR